MALRLSANKKLSVLRNTTKSIFPAWQSLDSRMRSGNPDAKHLLWLEHFAGRWADERDRSLGEEPIDEPGCLFWRYARELILPSSESQPKLREQLHEDLDFVRLQAEEILLEDETFSQVSRLIDGAKSCTAAALMLSPPESAEKIRFNEVVAAFSESVCAYAQFIDDGFDCESLKDVRPDLEEWEGKERIQILGLLTRNFSSVPGSPVAIAAAMSHRAIGWLLGLNEEIRGCPQGRHTMTFPVSAKCGDDEVGSAARIRIDKDERPSSCLLYPDPIYLGFLALDHKFCQQIQNASSVISQNNNTTESRTFRLSFDFLTETEADGCAVKDSRFNRREFRRPLSLGGPSAGAAITCVLAAADSGFKLASDVIVSAGVDADGKLQDVNLDSKLDGPIWKGFFLKCDVRRMISSQTSISEVEYSRIERLKQLEVRLISAAKVRNLISLVQDSELTTSAEDRRNYKRMAIKVTLAVMAIGQLCFAVNYSYFQPVEWIRSIEQAQPKSREELLNVRQNCVNLQNVWPGLYQGRSAELWRGICHTRITALMQTDRLAFEQTGRFDVEAWEEMTETLSQLVNLPQPIDDIESQELATTLRIDYLRHRAKVCEAAEKRDEAIIYHRRCLKLCGAITSKSLRLTYRQQFLSSLTKLLSGSYERLMKTLRPPESLQHSDRTKIVRTPAKPNLYLTSVRQAALKRSALSFPSVRLRPNGSLVGKVSTVTSTDPVMSAAQFTTIRLLQNGVVRHETISNREGFFELPNIQIGDYSLVACGNQGAYLSTVKLIEAVRFEVDRLDDAVPDRLNIVLAPAGDVADSFFSHFDDPHIGRILQGPNDLEKEEHAISVQRLSPPEFFNFAESAPNSKISFQILFKEEREQGDKIWVRIIQDGLSVANGSASDSNYFEVSGLDPGVYTIAVFSSSGFCVTPLMIRETPTDSSTNRSVSLPLTDIADINTDNLTKLTNRSILETREVLPTDIIEAYFLGGRLEFSPGGSMLLTRRPDFEGGHHISTWDLNTFQLHCSPTEIPRFDITQLFVDETGSQALVGGRNAIRLLSLSKGEIRGSAIIPYDHIDLILTEDEFDTVHTVSSHYHQDLGVEQWRSVVRQWSPQTGMETADPVFIKGVPLKGFFTPSGKWNLLIRRGVEQPDGSFGYAVFLQTLGDEETTSIVIDVLPEGFFDVAKGPEEGEWLLFGLDKTALWRAEDSEQLGKAIRGRVIALADDRRTVVTTNSFLMHQAWDTNSGRPIGEPLSHTSWVVGAGFRPGTNEYATMTDDGVVRFWNLKDQGQLTGDHELKDPNKQLFFGPRESYYSISSGGCWTHFVGDIASRWEFAADRERGWCFLNSSGPNGVVSLRNVLYSAQGILQVIDPVSGQKIGSDIEHLSVTAVALSGDDRMLITGSVDGVVNVWDLQTGEEMRPPLTHTGSIEKIKLSPQEDTFVVREAMSKSQIWSLKNRSSQSFLELNSHGRCMAYSSDGRFFAVVSPEGSLNLWDLRAKQMVAKSPPILKAVRDIKFCRDDEHLLIISKFWVHRARIEDAEIRIIQSHPLPAHTCDELAVRVDNESGTLLKVLFSEANAIPKTVGIDFVAVQTPLLTENDIGPEKDLEMRIGLRLDRDGRVVPLTKEPVIEF